MKGMYTSNPNRFLRFGGKRCTRCWGRHGNNIILPPIDCDPYNLRGLFLTGAFYIGFLHKRKNWTYIFITCQVSRISLQIEDL